MKKMSNVTDSALKTITLDNGVISVGITNYGATIMHLHMPDKTGRVANIVAGFATAEEYRGNHPYFGSVVGRFANRISGAKFELDGRIYSLSPNEKVNHLHGGWEGFDRKIWSVEDVNKQSVTLCYTSKDGEEGYPGNLAVTVRYSLEKNNKLLIAYSAVTDQPTVVSLTNHSYFNLSGFEDTTIYDHTLQIAAERYTVKGIHNTPNGETGSVAGTPLDFTTRKKLEKDIDQLRDDRGYDHNYILHEHPPGLYSPEEPLPKAATLRHEKSGRVMHVYTDQPGMQVYTSNWWDGSITGAQGIPYVKHGAIALETQAWPDAPNHPSFPSAVLRPGDVYKTSTAFELLVD